jgi:autotransporter-associated beta strand protein
LGSYTTGNMKFTASSGNATTLTFANNSAVTGGNVSGRSLTNNAANLSVVFAGDLAIGSNTSAGTGVAFGGAGNFTVNGAINTSGGSITDRTVTKTGNGTLTLNGANSYLGNTTISAGTLALNGNTTSAIALGEGTVLALALTNQVVSTNTLSFAGNATVSITGTPEAATTYNLLTASAITGTPALTSPIVGFSLVNTGTVLQLAPASGGDAEAPVIAPAANVTVDWGSTYVDVTPTASYNVDPSVYVITSGTVDTAKPDVYTLTDNATDAAGNPATPVTRNVTVAIANPTTVGADGLSPLLKYAFGANSPTDTVQVPVTSSTATTLVITAVVRTDDTALTVVGETNTDLTAPGAWTSTGVVVTDAADQTNLPAGCMRKVFTVSTVGATKKFLRLKADASF